MAKAMIIMNIIKRCYQKVTRYLQTRNDALLFYRFDAKEKSNCLTKTIDEFIDIRDYNALRQYANEHSGELSHLCNDDCLQRFEKSSVLSIAVKGGTAVAYGWLATSGVFWVAEIDCAIDLCEAESGVLFDFFTKIEFRGHGIYPALITHLNCLSLKNSNIIYCRKSNRSSQNGIQKAGGIFEGALRHNSRAVREYFQSKGFIWRGSALKLFGLRYTKL